MGVSESDRVGQSPGSLLQAGQLGERLCRRVRRTVLTMTRDKCVDGECIACDCDWTNFVQERSIRLEALKGWSSPNLDENLGVLVHRRGVALP
jgi:hypothetical protein